MNPLGRPYIDPGEIANVMSQLNNATGIGNTTTGSPLGGVGNAYLDYMQNGPLMKGPNPWDSYEDVAKYATSDEGINNSVDMLSDMAGIIRMGGKVYPNALLHRAETNPDALKWWGKLFQSGKKTQKPTSLVSPNMLPTFSSEPYGLLFNVTDESKIANRAFTEDVWSHRSRAIQTENDKRAVGRLTNTESKLFNNLMHMEVGDPLWGDTSKRWSNYKNALNKLSSPDRRLGEVWNPGVAPYNHPLRGTSYNELYPPGSVPDLDTLTNLQRGIVEEKLTKHKPTSPWIDHAEIIPDITPDMLAGVRLPLNLNRRDMLDEEMIRELMNFAEQRKVPIYRWDADITLGQQLEGLKDPFAGSWGKVPGADYKTSTRLPRYWSGIKSIDDLPKSFNVKPVNYGSLKDAPLDFIDFKLDKGLVENLKLKDQLFDDAILKKVKKANMDPDIAGINFDDDAIAKVMEIDQAIAFAGADKDLSNQLVGEIKKGKKLKDILAEEAETWEPTNWWEL